jgi:hypothetical protein
MGPRGLAVAFHVVDRPIAGWRLAAGPLKILQQLVIARPGGRSCPPLATRRVAPGAGRTITAGLPVPRGFARGSARPPREIDRTAPSR